MNAVTTNMGRGKGVGTNSRQRPFGCFALLVPDPFSGHTHVSLTVAQATVCTCWHLPHLTRVPNESAGSGPCVCILRSRFAIHAWLTRFRRVERC